MSWTSAGFCFTTSDMFGMAVLNILLVKWNIMADPESIMMSLTSGATCMLERYLMYSSSKTPS